MSRITTANNAQLAMSTIRAFLAGSGGPAPVATNISLADIEKRYMGNSAGGNVPVVTVAKVCMLGQLETDQKVNRGGTNPGNAGYTPGSSPTGWSYAGATVAWRPSRFSEFQQAYNVLPSLAINGQATGQTNSYGNLVFSFAGGSPAEFGSGTYYYYVYGNNTGVVPNGWNSVGGNASGASVTYNIPNSRGCSAYVVDDRFCGIQMLPGEITSSGSGTYP